jgi:magnesium transporter
MFRILDLDSSGKPQLQTDESNLAPPPKGVIRWIDLVEPTPATLEQLRIAFDLDAIAVADCSEFGAVSKIDDHDRYLFLVTHAFTADPDDVLGISIHEIHAFLGDSFLITVHDNPVPAQEQVWNKATMDAAVLRSGPSWPLYLALEAMVESTEPLVERIGDEVDRLERAVIEEDGSADPKLAFRIKRSAMAMRRSLRPLRDTLRILHRRGDSRVTPRATRYLRDLADVVVRLTERVEEVAEAATGVQNIHQALQATKATQLMKNLTIFSAVFLPLGVLVGFWGQNFHDLPYDSDFWFVVMLASLVAVPAGLLEWFRRNWF